MRHGFSDTEWTAGKEEITRILVERAEAQGHDHLQRRFGSTHVHPDRALRGGDGLDAR